jgi:hypothetical protein
VVSDLPPLEIELTHTHTHTHTQPLAERIAVRLQLLQALRAVLSSQPRERAEHPVEQRGGNAGLPPIRDPVRTRFAAAGGTPPPRHKLSTAIEFHGASTVVRRQFGNDGRWEADCKGVSAADGEGPERGLFS